MAVEALSRRDFDALMALYAEDAVLDRSLIGLEVIEGRDAIRAFFEDWTGAYDEYEQELEEFRDLGNGVGFAVLRQRGRPKDSSGSLELRYALVGVGVDGLIQRTTSYADIDEARAAAERLAEERG
jgi:ketosteroid isomerase-like protein